MTRYNNYENTEDSAPVLKVYAGYTTLHYDGSSNWLVSTCVIPAYFTTGSNNYVVLTTAEFKNNSKYMDTTMNVQYEDTYFQIVMVCSESIFTDSDSVNARYIIFGH